MRRQRGWLTTLSRADAVTYSATAFEASALLQLLDVWPSGIVVTGGVVVHQKDVLGHSDLQYRGVADRSIAACRRFGHATHSSR